MKTIQTAFSSGELSPALHARIDVDRYHAGLALCRNFMILAQGGAANRPGLAYVGPLKYADRKVRLIPFMYSSEDTSVLEFGHNYMRVVNRGAYVLEDAHPVSGISRSNPAVVTASGHGLADGDDVFLAGVSGMGEVNGRFFRITVIDSGSFSLGETDSTAWGEYVSGGTFARVYETETPYAEEELGRISYTQSADVMYLASLSHPPMKLMRTGAAAWSIAEINFTPDPPPPTITGLVPSPVGTKSYTYGVSVVVGGFSGERESQMAVITINNGPAQLGESSTNTLTWTLPYPLENVIMFRVYRVSEGVFHQRREFGPETMIFVDDNTVQMIKKPVSGPIMITNEFDGEGNYPGAVSFHEQRLWWASSVNRPHRLWASREGDFENLSARDPLQKDDPVTFQLATRQINEVRHMVSLKNLLVLTSGAEFQVSGNQGAIAPDSLFVKAEGYRGASRVRPLTIGETVLYVQEKGGRVRDFLYRYESDAWTGSDLTVMARHLFEGKEIVDWDYAPSPHGIVWAVMDDGGLLTLTYLREQEVTAWARHDTLNGAFEAVTVVGEGREDAVYFAVQREMGGKTVRTLERMGSRLAGAPENAFFVDCGLSYDGEPATVITGLNHLEGETVSILADGSVHPPRTVENGAVTLMYPASKVHAGLPVTSDMATLPLASDAALIGRRKQVTRVAVRVEASRGMHIGPSESDLTEMKRPSDRTWGAGPDLFTGVMEINVTPDWGADGAVFIRQASPLPLTVQAIVPEVGLGG